MHFVDGRNPISMKFCTGTPVIISLQFAFLGYSNQGGHLDRMAQPGVTGRQSSFLTLTELPQNKDCSLTNFKKITKILYTKLPCYVRTGNSEFSSISSLSIFPSSLRVREADLLFANDSGEEYRNLFATYVTPVDIIDPRRSPIIDMQY